jgi:hypothetical protein
VLVEEKTKQFLFGLWWLGWLIVMVTSLEPGPRMPFDLSDKLIHFATFATMTAAVAGFCHEPRGILRWGMLSIMLGGLLELGQHLASRPDHDNGVGRKTQIAALAPTLARTARKSRSSSGTKSAVRAPGIVRIRAVLA